MGLEGSFLGRVVNLLNRSDVARFFEITRGHVLLAGPKTIDSVPQFARLDRELVVLRSSMNPPEVLERFGDGSFTSAVVPPFGMPTFLFVTHWELPVSRMTARQIGGSIPAG